MKHAALRGLVTGLILSVGILLVRPSWTLGHWIASEIKPHDPTIWLDVR